MEESKLFQSFGPQIAMNLDHGTNQIIGPGREIVANNSSENVLPQLRSVFSNVCWTT